MNDYFIKESFKDFLTSIATPTFHREKSTVLKLNEVYVFPKLLEFSEKDQDIDSVRLYFDSANFVPDSKGQKYVITGKTVSGKTSPCKTLFLKYNNYGYEEIFAPEPKVC